jgi:ribonuclease J
LAAKKGKLKVIALGGLNEIGKNLTIVEFGGDIVVIDCGVAFPEDEMLGIDLVIPDFNYLIKNKQKVKGILLTHGHEDHIGAVPYIYRELDCPLYATKLTLGLIEVKLKEHGLLNKVERICVTPGEIIKLGKLSAEFIATTHSIADSAAITVRTPLGLVLHSGDFKIDHTPIHGNKMDLQRFAALGDEGVLLFLCESTNVEIPGYSPSEKTVGEMFENMFNESPNSRIMVATFASNIHRIQQVIDCAHRHRRKVAVIGRSMLNNVKTASELGYLNIPGNIMIDVTEINKYPDEQIVVITTGSQGEPMSALTRMAMSEHKQISVKPGDTIIISASSIPGNEKSVSKIINELFKKGANVIYEGLTDTHVSGHAMQEELKIMHSLIRPKYFMPVHGEYRHLVLHKELAKTLGFPKDNIFTPANGEVLEISATDAKISTTVPCGAVYVDGLGVGDVGNIVLRDRKHLSEDGLIVVVLTIDSYTGEILWGPEIISRGFVYVRESEDLIEDAKRIALKNYNKQTAKIDKDNKKEKFGKDNILVKNAVRDALKEFVWQKTKRSPMILPIITEV